jgi:hypothetical protein
MENPNEDELYNAIESLNAILKGVLTLVTTDFTIVRSDGLPMSATDMYRINYVLTTIKELQTWESVEADS